MTAPTMRLPPTAKRPKVSMTWPAAPAPSPPCEEDEPGGGDVEREPEERGDEQQRGEDGEVHRAGQAQRHQEHQHRERRR